ncbi:hypothetical protein PXJ20_32585 [Paraburkholderia sp. A1RI_3L]|uniref:hypothetical protein n=1 Tax=Paraburkholderia TaxID=1822464 RepID=UPI003B80BDBC
MRQMFLDLWHAIHLVACPVRFVKLERRWYRQLRKERSFPPTVASRTKFVRSRLIISGFAVSVATVLGFVAALAVRSQGWTVQQSQQWWMQGGSAALLLWGTLFVRGWDIQTFGGKTLLERANRTIYVCLYFVGTAAGVFSLFIPVTSH